MFPLIDPKQFEQLGSNYQGFGETSAAVLADLNKALTAGFATTPGTQSGGGALRVESLDATLKIVSFMMKNIVFYNEIPKSKAYNTVEEYNMLQSYAGRGGFFISEGGLPRTEDSTYQRVAQFVKFMGTTREVTHPMLLVRPAHGNVVALETRNGAMYMLGQTENALFNANALTIPVAFNGLNAQLAAGYASATYADPNYLTVPDLQATFDMRGNPLTESVFQEAARVLLDNYMFPTHCYLPILAHSDFDKSFYTKGRYSIPVGQDATVGFNSDKVKTSGGVINLRPDVFLRMLQMPPSVPDNALAPTAPAAMTVATEAVTTSRGFQASEFGTYAYQITAISQNGESAPTNGSANAVVAAAGSAEVLLTITRGAQSGNDLTTGFRIYRSRLQDGAPGTAYYLVTEIACVGTTTTYKDGNEFLPGTGTAYIGQNDETVLTLRELSPMLKFPLATIASSIRWMQLYYNTPIVFRPRGWITVKNIGSLGVPSVGIPE